ncbi:TIGR04282 family arsenosugar biosynthesis glycosyltransferase [Falsihalocynthiibacter sp. SS001]|uniref:TIGR04282 family arsenosugar biosynthesis glycosyltransferase n=1 Tax=Falsihalocynthiibacter sp. SS001 TaxID=3349698 RepID=UPI0036D24930
MKRHLVIMLKEPRPGRVKTRLGVGMGMVAAAWWYRHQVARLLRRLDDPRWQITLAVAPDIEGSKSRIWPNKYLRVMQGQGDLGDRMARLFHELPRGPVVIIGSDIPTVEKHHINAAFKSLGNHQAVFGPSGDGGYWLVGLKRVARPPSRIFQNVRWSSEYALADSRASFDGLTIAEVATLQDIDTLADLIAHQSRRP